MHGTTRAQQELGTTIFSKSPAVVIENVEMTYHIASEAGPYAADAKRFHDRISRVFMGGRNSVHVAALKKLSLVAEHGESIGVIGLNGSGKSTLMKLICGKINPTSGFIYASSTPIMLGVSAALLPDLSGAQNISLGCMAMGMSKSEVAEKYAEIVDLAGLEDAIHLPMRSYSSGMASRLRFAIAASIDPEILIIDEALNTGDDEFKGRTKRRMDEIRRQAGCVFLVSHSLSTIRDLCTRIIWLDKGELLYDGDPKTGLYLYQKYTKALAAKDYDFASRMRKRMTTTLNHTRVEPRTAGRRKSIRS
jgi:teichoic acid transport system ATP-binding protein